MTLPQTYPGGKEITSGFDPAAGVSSVTGTTGAVDTKGAWVEVLAAADNLHDAESLRIEFKPGSSSDHRLFLIDVAFGGAGDEETKIHNLLCLGSQNISFDNTCIVYDFPLKNAGGQRISVRGQCTHATEDFRISITRRIGGPPGYGSVLTIGADVSNTSAVTCAVSTADEWQTPVEMVASLDRNVAGFIFARGRELSSWHNGHLAAHLLLGTGGEEDALSGIHIILTAGSTEALANGATPYTPLPIAAGQRLAMQVAASDVNSGDYDFEYALYLMVA